MSLALNRGLRGAGATLGKKAGDVPFTSGCGTWPVGGAEPGAAPGSRPICSRPNPSGCCGCPLDGALTVSAPYFVPPAGFACSTAPSGVQFPPRPVAFTELCLPASGRGLEFGEPLANVRLAFVVRSDAVGQRRDESRHGQNDKNDTHWRHRRGGRLMQPTANPAIAVKIAIEIASESSCALLMSARRISATIFALSLSSLAASRCTSVCSLYASAPMPCQSSVPLPLSSATTESIAASGGPPPARTGGGWSTPAHMPGRRWGSHRTALATGATAPAASSAGPRTAHRQRGRRPRGASTVWVRKNRGGDPAKLVHHSSHGSKSPAPSPPAQRTRRRRGRGASAPTVGSSHTGGA